ncbi:MAG TPA: hypothetical protein VII64_12845 [Thermodesulfobacteriota bacterium]
MELEKSDGAVEEISVATGDRQPLAGACCCPPLARVKDDCPVEPKEGGR